jgi:hypothetical protein
MNAMPSSGPMMNTLLVSASVRVAVPEITVTLRHLRAESPVLGSMMWWKRWPSSSKYRS